MAVQSFLAKEGLRFGILGSAASLAMAYPLANGDYSPTAHTDASRMGTYADRTPSSEAIVTSVMGVDTLRVGVLGLQLQVGIGIFPASTAGASGYASIRLPHGVAPDTNITNGDLWTTTAGLFARINGATVGPFGTGSTGGSGVANQVAYWSGASTLTGDAGMVYDSANDQLALSLGTAAIPAYSFIGDLNTGIYSGGPDSVGIATGGFVRFTFNTNDTRNATAQFMNEGGFAGAPAYTFTSSSTDGMYLIGANNIGWATNGVLRIDLSNSAFTSTVAISIPNGAVGTPSLRFANSGTTGIYRVGADNLGIAVAGVLAWDISATAMTSAVIGIFPASAAGASGYASIRLPHGAAPTDNITNGDLWTTTAGLFARINGATVGPFSAGGGGTIGGTIAATQVAFGTGVDTIGGDAGLVFDSGTNQLQTGTYSFTGTPNTYIGSGFGDDIDIICASTSVLDINAGRVISNVQIQGAGGNAAAPNFSFSAASDLGMFKSGGDLGFAMGGVERFTVSSTHVTGSSKVRATTEFEGGNGTSVKPTYSFQSDDNTGMYRVGADELGLAAQNVLIFSCGVSEAKVASGKNFWLGNAYTGGAPTPTGYLVIYDNTGTAYKVSAEAV